MTFYFNSCYQYKMNEIVNKFLLTEDKFMSEMYLNKPEFTYSACGPLNKNKEEIYADKKYKLYL